MEESKGQLAHAEGLFYQLIVRLHKFSMGRANYDDSVHWQRGLILDNDYNGRALLEHIGTDVKITVRAAYPERFLSYLTEEVKWLVESFWEGLRCQVVVPCIVPCGSKSPGTGLFEVQKLIDSKKKGRPEYPCNVSGCDEWQTIDDLLRNAPTTQPSTQTSHLTQMQTEIQQLGQVITAALIEKDRRDQIRYHNLAQDQQALLSKADQQFATYMQMLTDEAKDGPRLFSIKPIDTQFLDANPSWVTAKFQVTLWCEHSRCPLPDLNPEDTNRGVYTLELERKWLQGIKAWLKPIATVLSAISPVAIAATNLSLTDTAFDAIQAEINLTQKTLALATAGPQGLLADPGDSDVEFGGAICAQGSVLRQLHALLKAKDPSFGGLLRVQNKRREFVWIHPQFVEEY